MKSQFRTRDALIERIGLTLLSELQSGGSSSQLYIESLIQKLAVHLLRGYSTLALRIGERGKGLPQNQLQRAIEFINDNLDKELTLEAIAAETNFSPYYFARLFKRSTGLTPYQYVTQCRMKKAKSLLAKGNLAILEVGQQVGFHNQSHFSNVFRKFTGITPKA